MDFSEFPLYWVLTAVLVVVGQVVSVVSIRKNNLQWGRWGTILLLLPVILIVFRESFDHWGKTLASSMLFLIFSIIYWYAPQFSGSSVHSDIEDVGGDEE